MIKGRRVLALVPARGGSKGIQGKNIIPFCGKPLIAWTIEAALSSIHIDRVILSSDDDKIISVAKSYGCDVPFKREPHLALDSTPSIAVVIDALRRCPGYEWIVLLQPTSPLRTTEDIDGLLNLCSSRNAHSCVSMCEVEQNPYWMYKLTKKQTLVSIFPNFKANRRQELPAFYYLNGAIYAARVDWIVKSKSFISNETVAYLMPPERSIDIDTRKDLALAELICNGRLTK